MSTSPRICQPHHEFDIPNLRHYLEVYKLKVLIKIAFTYRLFVDIITPHFSENVRNIIPHRLTFSCKNNKKRFRISKALTVYHNVRMNTSLLKGAARKFMSEYYVGPISSITDLHISLPSILC